jgi:acyl-CoA thioester hydrolase
MNTPEFLQTIKFPFPIKQQVVWGEMDAWNHINNVIYFRYFETGRVEFFNKTNLWQTFIDENIRIVVGKLECNYIQQIVHPAEIEISVGIKKIGNASLTVHHLVTCNGNISAHGEGIIVATDPATGKSKPWSDKLREEFAKWL